MNQEDYNWLEESDKVPADLRESFLHRLREGEQGAWKEDLLVCFSPRKEGEEGGNEVPPLPEILQKALAQTGRAAEGISSGLGQFVLVRPTPEELKSILECPTVRRIQRNLTYRHCSPAVQPASPDLHPAPETDPHDSHD
jgi:hypothetical protein